MNRAPLWMVLSSINSTLGGDWRFQGVGKSPRYLEAALDLARANGLYYPFVRKMLDEGLPLPPGEQGRWKEEQDAESRFRNTLTLLGDVSRTAGIAHTVIKNAVSIEQVPRDVDVFVRDEDRAAFVDALTASGLQVLYNHESEISCVGPGLLPIDVYSRINYFDRDFLDPAIVESSRTTATVHGVPYPTLAPEEAFLVNSVHGLFGHGCLSLLDFVDLQILRTRIPDLGRPRAHAAERNWGRVFDLWMERLDGMRSDIYDRGVPIAFPLRLGRTFILECVAALDGRPLTPRQRRIVKLSLLWDDLVYATEGAGLDRVIRHAGGAAGIANFAGHRLRSLRGDRKSSAERAEET